MRERLQDISSIFTVNVENVKKKKNIKISIDKELKVVYDNNISNDY